MPLKKYMKAGQKISLRVINEESDGPAHLDALTTYLHGLGRQYLDLTIPYRTSAEERYPFRDGMTFEILTSAMGVGIQLTGTLEKVSGPDRIRIQHNNDVQMIRRRLAPRLDVNLEIGYTKSGGKLRTFRDQWKKYVRMIEQTDDLSKLPKVPRKKANISASGIGLMVAPPIEKSDIGMFLINAKISRKQSNSCARVTSKRQKSC